MFKKRITAIIVAVVAVLAIPTAVVAVINAMPELLPVSIVSEVSLTADAPELGVAPGGITVDGDDYVIDSYKWVNNKDGKEVTGAFEVNKAYALEVTLKAKKHAKFEVLTPVVENAIEVFEGTINADKAGNTLTFKALFPSVVTPVPDAKYYIKVKSDGAFSVIAPLSTSENLVMNFGRKGPNNIFEFKSFGTANVTLKDSTALVTPNYHGKMTSYTDMFGPYYVDATSEPYVSGPFTGGNHGYMNSGSTDNPANTPTGRCVYVDIYADGEKVEAGFEGLVDEIMVKWENRVQGRNTVKADGSGRELLKEEYTMVMDGEKLNVHNVITPLEEVKIPNYYGLQMTPWFDTVEYLNAKTPGPFAIGTSTATDHACREALFEKDGLYCKMFMLPVGIGNFEHLPSNKASIFTADYGKSYFYPLNDNCIFPAGEPIEFRGGYQFYYVEE